VARILSIVRYTATAEIGGYGSRATANDPECFGGCCNPMNLRAGKDGDVYTAESEGIIRRFGPKGEFLGVVGQVSLTGGCKNVAVGASPDGSKVYFCDQPGSRIIVMSKKMISNEPTWFGEFQACVPYAVAVLAIYVKFAFVAPTSAAEKSELTAIVMDQPAELSLRSMRRAARAAITRSWSFGSTGGPSRFISLSRGRSR
jgi:hypothetical protein